MRFQTFSGTFLILTLIFSTSDLTFVSGQCLQAQKDLLLELKNNLTYDSSLSTKLVQWDESTDCCRWGGVKCDSTGSILTLDLSNESISSGINDSTSSLFKLVFLQDLNLARNSLSFTDLPPGFGNLKDLRYLNLSDSGFSGQVPWDFSNLTRLVVLDLSSTFSSGFQLENPDLGRLIHNFTRLGELYLDGVNVSAQGPDWCNAISSSLPDLRVLSLSNAYLTGPFDSSLAKLKSLSVIHLDGNTFSSPFPEFFADFPNLRVLTISSCDLIGVVPAQIFQIKSLETIDLSNNRDLEGNLPEFPINGSLQNLGVSYTKFSGNVSESIGGLKMLANFDLRACLFSGRIPSSIRNLTHLVYLDLSINQFSGPIPSFALLKNLETLNLRSNGLTGRILDSLWQGLENLDFLDLSDNSLEGQIPMSLFRLPSLEVLYLSNNSFSGSIREAPNSSHLPLAVLQLDSNHIAGPIPHFFFELPNVLSLGLSSNKFNGSLELSDFQKLTNLTSLDLSHNNLSVQVNENISIYSLFPRLGTLRLASCRLQKIPNLKNHSSLMMLDLSDNQLNGEIPSWIWQVDGFLRFLNLSHNQFTHLEEPYHIRGLDYLDLHSNMLGGQIPLPPSTAVFTDFSSNNFSSSLPENIGNVLTSAILFSVSNNKIIGTIPHSLCNASRLQILDLSNNSLHGMIPSCLLNHSGTRVLNLGTNDLGGEIPDAFPVDCGLETLDLGWNVLTGEVPRTLARCTNLEVLNLGNNELDDVFPCWLKNLTRLRVLVLRSNKFHGDMSCLRDKTTWMNLQIIDIASNNLSGPLPEYLFRKLDAMMIDDGGSLDLLNFILPAASYIYYQDSVTVTLKGQSTHLEKILTIFTAIDFSNNHFSGAIPHTLGELKSLYVLNFSHNTLSGQIPATIGNLQRLESLDLSSNKLGGQIPDQIARLTFLSFLNVSYNQLVGRIPQGSQMQTFSESSFIGNPGLCGFPLDKTCSHFRAPPFPEPRSEEEHQIISDSGVYVSAAMGFVVGLGVIFGPLVVSKRWRRCYNGKRGLVTP